MLDSVVELVKFVGGLGGLASSAFLIYDWVFRYRPAAFLIPAEYKTTLRFKNVPKRPEPVKPRGSRRERQSGLAPSHLAYGAMLATENPAHPLRRGQNR
jgi:hypothetical protein